MSSKVSADVGEEKHLGVASSPSTHFQGSCDFIFVAISSFITVCARYPSLISECDFLFISFRFGCLGQSRPDSGDSSRLLVSVTHFEHHNRTVDGSWVTGYQSESIPASEHGAREFGSF
jgi:hypothetical protein